jgi:hypothetical protein
MAQTEEDYMPEFDPPQGVKILDFSPDKVKLNMTVAQYVPAKSAWFIGHISNMKVAGMIWASYDMGIKKRGKAVRTEAALCKLARAVYPNSFPEEYGKNWHFVDVFSTLLE